MHEYEPINRVLRDHQENTATSWRLYPSIRRLHQFFDLFNENLFRASRLPPAAISLDRTRRTRLGHFVPGRNGAGIRHNINLNSLWLDHTTVLEQLVTLAHEMVHLAQDQYGTPSKTGWYHNKEFCRRATGIGIVSRPPRGQVSKITNPFLGLCREHGVDDPLPQLDGGHLLPATRASGRSTLKKWSCRCDPPVNVWVGVSSLDAICNHCGELFERSM